MRVEIVEKLPQRRWNSGEVSNEGPSTRALQNFLAAINGEDSLFAGEHAGSGEFREAGKAGETYGGAFVITFRSVEDAQNAGLHFSLVEKLTELFRAAGSSASLGLMLCLTKTPSTDPGKSRLTLTMQLESSGDSLEQAEMRWGLGLAHVQQGLMFASRWLRQKQAARTN